MADDSVVLRKRCSSDIDEGNAANNNEADINSRKAKDAAATYHIYKVILAQAPKLRVLSFTKRYVSNLEWAVVEHLCEG